MSALPTSKPRQEPLPASQLGMRLCQIFGCYLWATIESEAPDPGHKPGWRTNAYKLTPRTLYRRWEDPTKLIGVRFGSETTYLVLDIDVQSPYHPKQDSDAFKQISLVLETLGICRILIVRSSHSGGLHLYAPFPEEVSSFYVALTVRQTLQNQGFEVREGTLELFPNVKSYAKPGQFSNYQAIRLPLQPQSGSYLVNEDGEWVSDDLGRFFQLWDTAASHQDMDALKQAIAHTRSDSKGRYRSDSATVRNWEEDLKNEIEQGWTGPSQTNHLIKTIACYGVVFLGLEGEALVNYVVQTATQSPGYVDWCRHQHEIKLRAKVWAKSVESYYWPLGTTPRREGNIHKEESGLNNITPFNSQISEEAQQRIKQAMAALENQGQLPQEAGARAKAIAETAKAIAGKGVSTRTLYNQRHLGLWHPDHYNASQPVTEGMCKIPELEPNLSISTLEVPEGLNSQNSDENDLFYTSAYMKGGGVENVSDFFRSFCSHQTSCRLPGTDFSTGDEVSFPSNPVSFGIFCETEKDSSPVSLHSQAEQLTLPDVFDFSDVHVGIQIEMRRLLWQPHHLQEYVRQTFAGKTKALLSDRELFELLSRLKCLEIASQRGCKEGFEFNGS